MDDTTSLVTDLLQKLTELDSRVSEYRQEMALEFRRYSHQRLQDVPGDVSAKVEKLVAERFRNYPALNPALSHVLDSQSQGNNNAGSPDEKAWLDRPLSPPAPPQSPVAISPVDDGTRSPHEREREFHGLFTPSYLPLLDAVQRRTPTPPALSPPVPEVKEPNSNKDTSHATLADAVLLRPDPVRRSTADTISSVTSDDSTARSRRSALRRSSSSSIKAQSPRRVRFDVEGEEVLPTSSPPVSPRAPDLPLSPLGNPTSLLDESYNAIIINEDTDLLGSSPPMPKKITSTDRLKAMTRNSTEDTSKWEVVGNLDATDDDEDDELVMAGLSGRRRHDTMQLTTDPSSVKSTAHSINDARLPTQLGAPLAAVKEVEENENANEADDVDDKTEEHNHPTESPNSKDGPYLGEEAMFDFDDGQDMPSNARDDKTGSANKYIEEEDEDENEDEEADATPTAENPILFSTSPAIPVTKPATSARGPSPPRQMAASVGSYRGKPFSIGVVRDPELHRKAAEMGDFYTFVGSVDGRSGVDESNSYRPELTYFDGTPRSLSERLMKEDMDEARQNAEAGDRG
ncbi:hypothetical protein M426DRAFT_20630 [Hypoxylon sp. CI-4A]|nr:hypothetical protein M426DRAFT_20630 [Hypoxylon sp. CI-4A]